MARQGPITQAVQGTGRRRATLLAVAVLYLAAIVYFAFAVRGQLEDLTTANSDNIQWNLSQAEIDRFALDYAVLEGLTSGAPDLDEIRRRFNVFYSRLDVILKGGAYEPIRSSDTAVPFVAEVDLFLQKYVPIVDGPDDALRAALPTLRQDVTAIRSAVRRIALGGIPHFATRSEQRREQVFAMLNSIAAMTAALFVLLGFMVYLLGRFNADNKRSLRQNAQINARLSAIAATSLDAIIVTDKSGIVLEYNGAAEEIFGYSPEEAINSPISRLIFPKGRASDETPLPPDLIAALEIQARVRIEGRRKSGETFPVEVSIAIAQAGDGGIRVAFLRDISTEVRAETLLREARDAAVAGENSKARMLAVMSHEMRTPLNGLIGTLDLLDTTELDSAQRRYLEVLRSSGDLLLNHVNDVLDISRLDAGKINVSRDTFDLNALVAELIDTQMGLAAQNGNSVHFHPSEDGEDWVTADPLRLRQVLLNLIANAIKFTYKGHITVEIEHLDAGDLVEIRIADDGIGIDESGLSRIFDDFSTLDASYGRRTEGTGLGLGIAKRMTRALGGEIGVESEYGEGSLFWVRVPMPRAKAPSPGERQAAARAVDVEAPIQPLDILLIEDNEINREVAQQLLQKDGHKVSLAHDGTEGVARAHTRAFDVILTDISMPGLDGTEVARRIRAGEGPSRMAPIVALTAHAMEADIDRFRAAGMDNVIVKPVTRLALRAALAQLGEQLLSTGSAADHAARQDDVLIDASVVAELRDEVGEARFADMRERFTREMAQELPVFRVSGAGDSATSAEAYAALAHRLSGSAALFGAMRLRAALIRLETAYKDEDAKGQAAGIDHLRAVWSRTLPGLTSSAAAAE